MMSEGVEDATPEAAPDGAGDEKAPSRAQVLMRNPRRLIIAAILILIAVLVAVFTTATFTTSSANAGNVIAAGDLSVDNDLKGAAILTANGLVPGDSATGTVQISNVGSAAGNFSLTTTNLKDTPATPPFSGKLDLVITDITNASSPSQVYSGKLNAVGTVQLGKWAAGTSHKYKFTATFPNGTPAEDNQYKNASTTIDFVWNVVS
jgi:hypothetical protein